MIPRRQTDPYQYVKITDDITKKTRKSLNKILESYGFKKYDIKKTYINRLYDIDFDEVAESISVYHPEIDIEYRTSAVEEPDNREYQDNKLPFLSPSTAETMILGY